MDLKEGAGCLVGWWVNVMVCSYMQIQSNQFEIHGVAKRKAHVALEEKRRSTVTSRYTVE